MINNLRVLLYVTREHRGKLKVKGYLSSLVAVPHARGVFSHCDNRSLSFAGTTGVVDEGKRIERVVTSRKCITTMLKCRKSLKSHEQRTLNMGCVICPS